MKSQDMIYIVEDLEQELYDKDPAFYEKVLSDTEIGFIYSSNGWSDAVTFCGHCLYCSEVNSEDEIEEAGGFKKFLIQERDKFIDMLVKVKENNINLELILELMCELFTDTMNNSNNRRLLPAWSDCSKDLKCEIRNAMRKAVNVLINE